MTHYDKEREVDELWRNAPSTATHYGGGKFWLHTPKAFMCNWMVYDGLAFVRSENSLPSLFPDYQERPQHNAKHPETAQDALNKYSRNIIGLCGKTCQVDVYRVLEAFEVDSHAIAHSIKKLLAPGLRHAKTREQDLKEAIKSIEAELLLMSQR